MTKILAFFAAALGLSCLGISDVSAQAAPFGGLGPKSEEPLQMVIDYGVGQPKHRESHHGLMEPVSLAVGQTVEVTLRFLRKNAGGIITISPLDGGQIDPQGPVTISSDGSVVFHYQSALLPGLYRLAITGAQQYQISFYAVDPNQPKPSRPGGH
jgi:hypothetical protein